MSDKTEAPTPHRMSKARESGEVARSTELNTATGLLAAFWLLRNAGGQIVETLTNMMRTTFGHITAHDLTFTWVSNYGASLGWQAGSALLPLMGGLVLTGLATGIGQTGGLFTFSALTPKPDRLNPLTGIKRLFSVQSLVELLKALIKVGIIGWVCYTTINDYLPQLLGLGSVGLMGGVSLLGQAFGDLGTRASFTYLIFAIGDYVYQRRRWLGTMKMSKQDVRDESKSNEGDPQLRGRIRQQQRRFARQRMMQKVPEASVVLINPTHLAVALQYERGKMQAPRVVAKGALKIAERIVAIARANGVPVIQNIPLARALYAGVQVDQEIPAGLYQAVAEVLAFVFNLKQHLSPRNQTMVAQPS